MATSGSKQRRIPTLVKDNALVAKRRRELVDAAVGLFVRQGFHKTTTREIAAAAGWSVGALYEYIKAKEDILYLVCDAIHTDMEAALRERIAHADTGRATLEGAIAEYVRTCDRMQDAILLIYRETSALAPKSRRYVLENEARITAIFTEILQRGIDDGTLRMRDGKASSARPCATSKTIHCARSAPQRHPHGRMTCGAGQAGAIRIWGKSEVCPANSQTVPKPPIDALGRNSPAKRVKPQGR
ncbi:MAG: TetR/AcrR family transcriptional regulator [Candidatus Hydrogenedentota bacterium]